MTLHPLALALLALLPAAVAWWTGQRLLRRLDDPALPELLLRRRSRVAQVWGVMLVVMIAAGASETWWTLPLMAVAAIVAGFPTQRVLLQETWGLGAFLWHTLRRLAGSVLLWILIAFTPSIILGAGDVERAAALTLCLAVVLVPWSLYPFPVWLRAFGATPLRDRPDLAERFAGVIAKSTVASPPVYRFGAPGERASAAYALPGAHGTGAVAFSDALLDLLTPEEATAVFAHEVAHLEHYTPLRMRRLRVTTALLVASVLLVPLLAWWWAPQLRAWLLLLGPAAVIVGLLIRVSRAKAHETESDIRGAQLCGDPEALISALTKLHTALRLPRRWPADVERTATHPSLANRIRALRAALPAASAGDASSDASVTVPAAGAAREPLAAPVVVRSSRPGTYVAFDASRVHLFEGVDGDVATSGEGAADVAMLAARAAESRSTALARLSRLAIEGDGGGTPRLVAAEHSGRRWSVPLHPADVAAARAALDVVDVRIGPPAAERSWTESLPPVAVAAIALALLLGGELGVLVIPAALALFRPSAAALAGLGAAAATRALLSLLGDDTPSWVSEVRSTPALVLAASLGVLVCWHALRRVHSGGATAEDADHQAAETAASRAREATFALGGLALLYAAFAGWAGWALVPSDAAPVLRTLVALLVGFGAALAARARLGRRRWAVAGAAAAAVVSLVLARSSVAEDGGAAPAPPVGRAATITAALPLAGGLVRDLELSPSGRHFVVRRYAGVPADGGFEEDEEVYDEMYDEAEATRPPRVELGSFATGAASPRALEGVSAAFVSDDELLVLSPRPRHSASGDSSPSQSAADSLGLRIERIASVPADSGAPSLGWKIVVPRLILPRIHAGRTPGRWTIVGRDPKEPRVPVSIEGRIGDTTYVVHRWRTPGAADDAIGFAAVTPQADGVLAVRYRSLGAPMLALSLVGVTPWLSEIWRLDAGGARRLAGVAGLLRCVEGASGQPTAGAACTSMGNRGRTTVLTVDAGGRVTTLGTVPEPVTVLAAGPDGRVATVLPVKRQLLLFDATGRRSSTVPLPESITYATELRWVAGGIAVLGSGRDGSAMQLVLLEPRT